MMDGVKMYDLLNAGTSNNFLNKEVAFKAR